ncbi:MAG: hypothetical protein V4460_15230 [Pseudomonadota bacterium]|jgi:hypothetical protein
MIPEYKLYHGAVLAEIVQGLPCPVTIDELDEDGRLSSYILNEHVGLQIKHSTQRLRPWSFTFTRPNVAELLDLRSRCSDVFVVFVGGALGMVCISIEEMIEIMDAGDSGQIWIRIDRPRGKWFSVFGAKGPLAAKKPNGLECLLDRLQPADMKVCA